MHLYIETENDKTSINTELLKTMQDFSISDYCRHIMICSMQTIEATVLSGRLCRPTRRSDCALELAQKSTQKKRNKCSREIS